MPERGEPAIQVGDLHITRGGVSILRGVDLLLEKGRFLGIVGPNGGGKTTLLRVLVGLEKIDRGSVCVLGEAPGRSRAVGYVPQAPTFDFRFPGIVRDVIGMGLASRSGEDRRRKIDRILEDLGLSALARKPVGVLSGGERQRLFLARALVRDPELLLLDEPTLGVDPAALEEFLHLLEQMRSTRELTIVMVNHDFSVISTHTDQVLCVAGTVHFCGSPSELDEGRLAQAFGVHKLFLEHRH